MGKRTNTAAWLEKQGRWQIKVQKDGRRRTFTSSTPGRAGQREANAKADAWLDEGIENASRRVEQIVPEYLEDIRVRTSTTNHRDFEYLFRVWITPRIGSVKIGALNSQHLQSVINDGHKKGLSKKTLSKLRSAMSGFLKYCRKCKLTTFFPEDIVIPKGAPISSKRILQPNDIQVLFSVDTTIMRKRRVFDDLINAYRLQVLIGLRPSELLGLMWSDIKGDILTIQRGITYYGELSQGKNDNARRAVVLSPLAKQVIEEQRVLTGSSLYLFPIKESHYCSRLKRYCASNGITVVTPYELRHTFVSIAKTLPEGEVKSMVGHSRSMDTFGVYGHAVNGENQRVADKLEKIFSDILAPAK